MRFLLASGLGPYSMSGKSLEGTLLGATVESELTATYERLLGAPLDLSSLRTASSRRPLLRPYHGRLHAPSAYRDGAFDRRGSGR
ncbi:hypothetical protein [Thiocapsa bogorovii]|uniref:hypothetical protein n=1 Tax=Thiocapsa bogorovii TaxID=521689 RepID=UPI001E5E6FAF|nr:hypothetical protein [Thiocapsa bogorovii]UHD14750.1 hypothetical protein LT988_15830 [Thiocapsa bogorovii]